MMMVMMMPNNKTTVTDVKQTRIKLSETRFFKIKFFSSHMLVTDVSSMKKVHGLAARLRGGNASLTDRQFMSITA